MVRPVDKATVWLTERYPRAVEIPGDGTAQFLLMTAAYAKEVHGFTTSLPPEDLLYLRDDIADPKVVNEWIRNINRGETISILARKDGPLVGFTSLHQTRSKWTRGIGEVRVNVSLGERGKGVGRMLTLEIIGIARKFGLRKLTAQMTAEQTGARAAFHRLGFVENATLPSWVEDRKGMAHDLVIMSHELLD